MARGRRRTKAEPRKTYELVTKETQEGKEALAFIADVKKRFKPDLHAARIGAAWMIGKKADKDGRVTLGRLKKCSELERQLHQLDAIVLLNQDRWRLLQAPQRLALVHHEMCHLAEALDSNGDVAYDGHGEKKWRTVKHDIEEFQEIVRTHGAYKRDLAAFAEDLLKKDPNLSLFDGERNALQEKPIGKDVMTVPKADGGNGKGKKAEEDAPNRKLITNRGQQKSKPAGLGAGH